jgi:hypothetical protein
MTDADGDNVWEITFPALPTNTPIEYKFLNGPGGWETSPDLQVCGVDDVNGAFNRADTTETTDVILPAVCFNSCEACPTTDIPGCTDPMACNFDANATLSDGSCVMPALWFLDADFDGFYIDDSLACSAPSSSYSDVMGVFGDCDDSQSLVNASGIEICGNGVDEDCSGTDLACAITGCTDVTACNYNPLAISNDGSCIAPTMWYLDADIDGYYADDSLACSAPSIEYTATVGIEGDCDDNAANINPGAEETCDLLDNNCNQEIDEFVQITYYADVDVDGFGDINETILSCSPVAGYVDNGEDCDDGLQLFLDSDADGFGGQVLAACGELNSDDCDDNNVSAYPGAVEFCENTIDENCDGVDDLCVGIPGCTDPLACNFDPLAQSNNGTCDFGALWFLDADADGYASESVTACSAPSANHTSVVLPLNDCNDSDALINPNVAEICGNGIDENCDGIDDVCIVLGCTDALACNYDAAANTNDNSCTYAISWYLDADADGYATESVTACSAPSASHTSVVLPLNDCNDNDALINPNAIEICGNGLDENCDGNDDVCIILGCTDVLACNYEPLANTDDNSCTFAISWYLDADADGYASESITACSAPSTGYTSVVLPFNDCNDNDALINPNASEICGNGLDDNCDGIDDVCIVFASSFYENLLNGYTPRMAFELANNIVRS